MSTLVEQVMTRDVFALRTDTSLATAARLFALHQISGAPVVDEQGHAVGVISKTDLVSVPGDLPPAPPGSQYYRIRDGEIRAVGTTDEGASWLTGKVDDVMTRVVLAIARDATVRAAARLMVGERVHRLIVLEAGRLVGVITALDCLRALAGAPLA